MKLIDVILNLAGVLLWLAWWAPANLGPRFKFLAAPPPAEAAYRPSYREYLLPGLAGLLLLRSLVYWQIGPPINWQASLDLEVVTLPFRCDYWDRMLLYSVLSFLRYLAGFYLCLILFSMLNQRTPEGNAVLRWVRSLLGWMERWPFALKLLLPFILGFVAWIALNPLLSYTRILPRLPGGWPALLEQAVVMGLSAYQVWKIPLLVLLFAHLITAYTYLGEHPLWEFIHQSAQNLLRPLECMPLRLGKIDFAPIIAIGLIILFLDGGLFLLIKIYRHLPL